MSVAIHPIVFIAATACGLSLVAGCDYPDGAG